MRILLVGLLSLLFAESSAAQTYVAVKVKATAKKPAVLAGSAFELDIYQDMKQSDLHESLIERKRIVILSEPVELELLKKGTPLSEVRYNGAKYYLESKSVGEWIAPKPSEEETKPIKPPVVSPPVETKPPSTPPTLPKPPPAKPVKPAPIPPEFFPDPPEDEQPTKPDGIESPPPAPDKARPKKDADPAANAGAATAAVGAAGASVFLLVVIALVGVLFTLTPFLIALYREHESKWAILAVSIIFSWCILGWIWALIWSLSNPGRVTIVNR